LYQFGIPHAHISREVPGHEVRVAGGVPLPADFTFTGHGFTDGALRGGATIRCWRSGWAAVLVSDCGKVIAGLYGPCPDPFPSSLRAELWAILMMLRLALPPLTIWTDSAGAVDGWFKGKEWCCSSSRPAADLWRSIWAILDDIGPGVEIKKVKGHATEADVQAGRATQWQKDCNDHADHFAKHGAIVAEHKCPTELARGRYAVAVQWYRWLSELIANWPKDTQEVVKVAKPPMPPKPVEPTAIELPRHESLPHSLDVTDDRLRCSKCSKAIGLDREWSAVKAFAKGKCLGTARSRVVEATTTGVSSSSSSSFVPVDFVAGRNSLGHCLYQSGPVTWCRRCAYWATSKPRRLLEVCTGNSSTNRCQLDRLLNNVHPDSRVKMTLPVPFKL